MTPLVSSIYQLVLLQLTNEVTNPSHFATAAHRRVFDALH